MNKITIITTKIITLLICIVGTTSRGYAQHKMQHGFVLGLDDKFASHLVANGHHSRQTEITGQLIIDNPHELDLYIKRKLKSAGNSYFLFQAQDLDLSTLLAGQVLIGHIVESRIGNYEPRNVIVSSAAFRVQKVLLNIPNPFFTTKSQRNSSFQSQYQFLEGSYVNGQVGPVKIEKKHCCDTGSKPCNWKC